MSLSQSFKQNNNLTVLKLIQPDLLSKDELVYILRERGVSPSLLCECKEKLISLFKRVALPLPQRELRQNYRGSLLMKLRRKSEHIKICTESNSNDLKSFTIGVSCSTRSENISEDKCFRYRIKPPPDLINYEKKKIRLNSIKDSSESLKCDNDSNLEKIVIKKRKSTDNKFESEQNCIKAKYKSQDGDNASKRNALCNNTKRNSENNSIIISSSKDECNCNNSSSASKKISLKRNYRSSKSTKLSMSEETSDSSSEPEKKRAPITWP